MTTLTVNGAGRRRDYYQILGVSHTADFREIGAGYWRMARGASGERRAELNEAYEALNDEDRRRAYDAQWAAAGYQVEDASPEPASSPSQPEPAQPAAQAEAGQHVEERRTEPANGPFQAGPVPAQPAARSEAGQHVEESRSEPVKPGRQPEPVSSERQRQVKAPVPEPDDSLDFTRRLGWPKAM